MTTDQRAFKICLAFYWNYSAKQSTSNFKSFFLFWIYVSTLNSDLNLLVFLRAKKSNIGRFQPLVSTKKGKEVWNCNSLNSWFLVLLWCLDDLSTFFLFYAVLFFCHSQQKLWHTARSQQGFWMSLVMLDVPQIFI